MTSRLPRPSTATPSCRVSSAAGTRKLYATEKFDTEVFGDGEGELSPETIKGFVKQRRAFLLAHPDIKALDGTR